MYDQFVYNQPQPLIEPQSYRYKGINGFHCYSILLPEEVGHHLRVPFNYIPGQIAADSAVEHD